MVKLFVSGFPLTISELEIAQLLAPHGDIATIKLVCDRQTKKCKGYAFVEMVSEQDAQQVIDALNDAQMADRVLTVKITEDKPVPASNLKNHNTYHQKSLRKSLSPEYKPVQNVRAARCGMTISNKYTPGHSPLKQPKARSRETVKGRGGCRGLHALDCFPAPLHLWQRCYDTF